MVDLSLLESLRAAGVKRAVLGDTDSGIVEVEFFAPPGAPPLFEPERFFPETLVPPPPEEEGPSTERPPADNNYKVAPALAAILRKPSVS